MLSCSFSRPLTSRVLMVSLVPRERLVTLDPREMVVLLDPLDPLELLDLRYAHKSHYFSRQTNYSLISWGNSLREIQ